MKDVDHRKINLNAEKMWVNRDFTGVPNEVVHWFNCKIDAVVIEIRPSIGGLFSEIYEKSNIIGKNCLYSKYKYPDTWSALFVHVLPSPV